MTKDAEPLFVNLLSTCSATDIADAREALRPLKLIYSPRVFGHP